MRGGYSQAEQFARSNKTDNERIGPFCCLGPGWKKCYFFVIWEERTEAGMILGPRAIASPDIWSQEWRAWTIHEKAQWKSFSAVAILPGG